MTTDVVKFLAVSFCALALVPAGAHLMELFNTLHLPADQYLIAQQLYRGWALSGVFVIGALVSTFALAVILRHRQGFAAAVIAVLCTAGTQVVFWCFSYSANVATHNSIAVLRSDRPGAAS